MQFPVCFLQDSARNTGENFVVCSAPHSLTVRRPGLRGAPGLAFDWLPFAQAEGSVKITKRIRGTEFLRVNTARSESKSGAAPPWGALGRPLPVTDTQGKVSEEAHVTSAFFPCILQCLTLDYHYIC